MGNKKAKKASGSSVTYLNRNQAINKLQLKFSQFNRLCILKGIYPVQPKNVQKLTGGKSSKRTFYLKKDINQLCHEPLLQKFREFSIYTKKLKKHYVNRRLTDAKKFKELQPIYSLDHLVKERYPSFTDALRDLDDALCLIFLYARLPGQQSRHPYGSLKIPLTSSSGAFTSLNEENCGQVCSKLADEFMLYVIESHSLKKCFISIKGIYYQAEINGIPITWVAPHHFPQYIPRNVDFRIMRTFLEFYATLLGFVNFRLYKSLSLCYPPTLNDSKNESHAESSLSSLTVSHNEENSVPVEIAKDELLFQGKVFFISREVPKTPFEFVIRSMGGTVAWDGENSPLPMSDASINYHVMDRPSLPDTIHIGRAYVQPQFVFDCINSGEILDAKVYAPGQTLPPHMSPFVEEDAEFEEDAEEANEELERGVGDRPTNEEIMEELNAEDSEDESDEDGNSNSEAPTPKLKSSNANMEKERQEMAISMMNKSKRTMYAQMKDKKKTK